MHIHISGKTPFEDIKKIDREYRGDIDVKECAFVPPLYSHFKWTTTLSVGDDVAPLDKVLDLPSHANAVISPHFGTITYINKRVDGAVEKIGMSIDFSEKKRYLKRGAALSFLIETGVAAHGRKRPFDTLINTQEMPSSIFIKSVDCEPCSFPTDVYYEMHIDEIVKGLEILGSIAPCHVIEGVHSKKLDSYQLPNVSYHTVDEKYPGCSPSVHIEAIDPITDCCDVRWVFSLEYVIDVGHAALNNKIRSTRTICVSGHSEYENGLYTISKYGIFDPKIEENTTLIFGGLLSGKKDCLYAQTTASGAVVLGNQTTFKYFQCMTLVNENKSLLSTYIHSNKKPVYTTSQHGEKRHCIDSQLYQNYFLFDIPLIFLMQSLKAKEYDKAITLGALEIARDDVLLVTFIDPSKQEIADTIEKCLLLLESHL